MKKVYMALIPLFVAVSFLSASYHSNMTEEEAFLDANASFDKQDFDAARKSYSDFTDKFPQSKHRADALIRLAETAPSIEEADRIYHSVIADYAGAEPEARARAGLGKMYYAAGDYIKARGYFEAVVQKFPDAAPAEESYYYTALCIYAAKDYDALDSIIDSYIKKNFSAYKGRMQLLRAEELYAREKYQDAAAVYRQVIDAADTKEKTFICRRYILSSAIPLKKAGIPVARILLFPALRKNFRSPSRQKGQLPGSGPLRRRKNPRRAHLTASRSGHIQIKNSAITGRRSWAKTVLRLM